MIEMIFHKSRMKNQITVDDDDVLALGLGNSAITGHSEAKAEIFLPRMSKRERGSSSKKGYGFGCFFSRPIIGYDHFIREVTLPKQALKCQDKGFRPIISGNDDRYSQ